MNKGETLKRKRVLTLSQKEKGQSPKMKMNFDFSSQVWSSAELLKQYQIKKEKVVAESKKNNMKAQAPEIEKTTPATEGQSRLPMKKNTTQQAMASSQRQERDNLPRTKTTTQGEVFSQKQGKNNIIDGGKDQSKACTQEQHNQKKVKRKPICPAMSLDRFFEKEGVQFEEDEQDGHMQSPIHEGNNDDDVAFDDHNGDARDEVDGIDHEDGDDGTFFLLSNNL